MGLYRKYGLRVELCRELGWASISERLMLGQIDLAHALGPMPIADSMGTKRILSDCRGLMMISRQGNGITLSEHLRAEGVVDVASFADYLNQVAWEKPALLGVVAPYSSHARLLRQWLSSLALKEERHYRLVTIPPQQFLRHLEAGTLLGACVGEPWNSIAVARGLGFCVAVSSEIAPDHPEKVLACHSHLLVSESRDQVTAVVAATLEACQICADPSFLPELAGIMAKPEYLNLPKALLQRSYDGNFERHFGGKNPSPFISFFGQNAISLKDQQWLSQCIRGIAPSEDALAEIFPSALYDFAQSPAWR